MKATLCHLRGKATYEPNRRAEKAPVDSRADFQGFAIRFLRLQCFKNGVFLCFGGLPGFEGLGKQKGSSWPFYFVSFLFADSETEEWRRDSFNW